MAPKPEVSHCRSAPCFVSVLELKLFFRSSEIIGLGFSLQREIWGWTGALAENLPDLEGFMRCLAEARNRRPVPSRTRLMGRWWYAGVRAGKGRRLRNCVGETAKAART